MKNNSPSCFDVTHTAFQLPLTRQTPFSNPGPPPPFPPPIRILNHPSQLHPRAACSHVPPFGGASFPPDAAAPSEPLWGLGSPPGSLPLPPRTGKEAVVSQAGGCSTEGQTWRKAQLPPRRGEGARPDPPPEEARGCPSGRDARHPLSAPASLKGGKRPRRRPIRGARGGSQARRRERAGRCHSARVAPAAPGGPGLRGAEASRTRRPGLLRPLGSSSPRGGLPARWLT